MPEVNPKIGKSIEDLQDQDDLLRLYEEFDLNSDGLIGPDEAADFDIASIDVSADGYLSLWEIAKARGLDSGSGSALLNISIFKESAFDSPKTTLTAPAIVAGFECPAGTVISVGRINLFNRNQDMKIIAGSGGVLRYKGIPLKEANLPIEEGTRQREITGVLAGDASIKVGDRAYKFADGGEIRFDMRGQVAGGRLAEDIQSPYGSGLVHKIGEDVKFVWGRLVDGSRECFKAFFPDVKLRGNPRAEEIEKFIVGFAAVPENLRDEIKRVYVINRKDSERYGFEPKTDFTNPAFADRRKHAVVFLRDHPQYLYASTIYHEAAHIHTYGLERAGSDFFRMWNVANERAPGYGDKVSESGSIWAGEDVDQMDELLDMPRYGYARAYGNKNFGEDVSTYMDLLFEGRTNLGLLMDPNSSYYEAHPEERGYATIYRIKLKLLRDYGYITDDMYRRAVPHNPGLLGPICRMVNCP